MQNNVVWTVIWLILAILSAIGGIVLIQRFWTKRILPCIKKLLRAIKLRMAMQSNAGVDILGRRMDLSIRMLYTGIMFDKIPPEVLKASLSRKFLDIRHHLEKCKSVEDRNTEIEFARWYMGCLISYASVAKIRFDELAPLIVDSTGIDLAKNIVSMRNILEHYGPDAVTTWKTLIEG